MCAVCAVASPSCRTRRHAIQMRLRSSAWPQAQGVEPVQRAAPGSVPDPVIEGFHGAQDLLAVRSSPSRCALRRILGARAVRRFGRGEFCTGFQSYSPSVTSSPRSNACSMVLAASDAPVSSMAHGKDAAEEGAHHGHLTAR